MGSGKSDGETIRGDGKGINVSRKSKPGVGHKFAISSLFGTASRTNSFVASVSFLRRILSSRATLEREGREEPAIEGGKGKNMKLISISEPLFLFISRWRVVSPIDLVLSFFLSSLRRKSKIRFHHRYKRIHPSKDQQHRPLNNCPLSTRQRGSRRERRAAEPRLICFRSNNKEEVRRIEQPRFRFPCSLREGRKLSRERVNVLREEGPLFFFISPATMAGAPDQCQWSGFSQARASFRARMGRICGFLPPHVDVVWEQGTSPLVHRMGVVERVMAGLGMILKNIGGRNCSSCESAHSAPVELMLHQGHLPGMDQPWRSPWLPSLSLNSWALGEEGYDTFIGYVFLRRINYV